MTINSIFAQVSLDEIKGIPGPGYQNMPIGDAPSTLETIISNTVGFLTVAAGLSFAIYILLAGLTWITAREESERISRAKQMFTNALVGLAIVVSSWAFAGIMQTVFGFDILSPKKIIESIIPKGGGGGGGTGSPTAAPGLPVPTLQPLE